MSKFFEGWYHKHQKDGRTFAVIPGATDENAFIQIITDDRSYYVDFDRSSYRKGEFICVGDSRFSRKGIVLDIDRDDIKLKGALRYENLCPLSSDIMGFFRFLPMECRHGVISMNHDVFGCIELNGVKMDFNGGTGYIECDSGRSFPKRYAWVQCNDFSKNLCVMASIAQIPLCGLKFDGIICSIILNGKECRLATYNGAKVRAFNENEVAIERGKQRLEVKILGQNSHMLYAPNLGKMVRQIKENPAVKARFRFYENDVLLLDEISDGASFEYA